MTMTIDSRWGRKLFFHNLDLVKLMMNKKKKKSSMAIVSDNENQLVSQLEKKYIYVCVFF